MLATCTHKTRQQHRQRHRRGRRVRLWPVIAMSVTTGTLILGTVASGRRSLGMDGYVHINLQLLFLEVCMIVMTVWMAVKWIRYHR